jgi:hypothetical protein
MGLSLMAALGLMAFAVAGAHAANLKISEHVRGESLILGKSLKASSSGATEGGVGILVPNLGMEISCTSFDVLEGVLNPTGEKGHGASTLLFLGCKVFPIEKVAPFKLTSENALPCLPLDSVSGEDGSIREKALNLVIVHEKKDYLVFESVTGVPFAEIIFSAGTGCPLPLKTVTTGQYGFEIVTGDTHTGSEVTEPLITAGNKSTQELLGLKLLYGANEAFLDGSAKLVLTGEHKGCTWGFL